MFDAILWDVDGTLLDFIASQRESLFTCFELFGFGKCTEEMHQRYSAINISLWEMLERGERTKAEILTERFRRFFAETGLPEEKAEDFNAEYEKRLPDTVRFFPHALETVEALKGKVIQCSVTNGTKYVQERKMNETPLGGLFDRLFISETVGAEKPDPRFFEAVFRALRDIPKERILIVGDSLTSDILGGLRAGIHTCWFNPDGKKGREEIRPEYEIRDLREVLTLAGYETDPV